MNKSSYVPEHEAYALLERAGLHPPRHGVEGGPLPFETGEPVVVKGLGENLWHKTELEAVRFLPYEKQTVASELLTMRCRLEATGHPWRGGLVCEQIDILRNPHLPSEAFISLTRGEAGWVVLCGFGGLLANTLAELAPPLRWPLACTTARQAGAEFEKHLLGRIWLGRERGTRALTTPDQLQVFFGHLWTLATVAEADGLTLMELNPVALDPAGQPRPLAAVGFRGPLPARHQPPPVDFLDALRAPQRIAIAGVSTKEGTVGRIILDNLGAYPIGPADLIIIKPGQTEFLGHPCVPDVNALLAHPVDLLLIALPAPVATEVLLQLITQGGGARCVGLVAGGIGDGADESGLGIKLATALHAARAEERWTPAVVGPNFLGHWVPQAWLHTSFIPTSKLAAPSGGGGELTLLSQSGAFLLSLLSRQPRLRFGLALPLGNQMDVALCDVLTALTAEPGHGPVACYVEGFGPGQLLVAARAVARLRTQGRHVLIHRAGRTSEGQAAAASHTGAMAGDTVLERSLLECSGAKFADTLAEFDAAITWLGAFPHLETGPVALVTNAGFECVNASDLFDSRLPALHLEGVVEDGLRQLLARHKLAGLVAPRLPLDLTPMAGPSDFIAAAALLLAADAVLLLGLIPFTRQLDTSVEGATKLTRFLTALKEVHRKPMGVVVDSGPEYAEYRRVFEQAGLPVFDRMETALRGLRVLWDSVAAPA